MDQQHLFRYSKSYAWVKKYVKFAHSLFYKEVCVVNAERVPDNEPVIFVPNHQNALMDALAILLTVDKQPVFMARADIFKKPTVAKILHFLKIIPVYRIRDGVNSLSNNDQTFDIAFKALASGQSVGIMPEGNHGDQHLLRPLKKGVIRLAFNAQEQLGSDVRVKIVPVGLEYSHYSNFRSRLLVNYGVPIEVNEFLNDYKTDPQKTINEFRDKLAGEMKKYMLNVDNQEYYNLILDIKNVYAPRLQKHQKLRDNYYGRFCAEKELTDKLVAIAENNPAILDNLKPLVQEYNTGLKKLKLRNWLFNMPQSEKNSFTFDVIKSIAFFPIFLIAFVFNALPYYLTQYFSGKTDDTQFRSSFKFAVGLILFTLYYLSVLIWPLPLISRFLLIITMPVLGILSFVFAISIKKILGKRRYFKMIQRNDPELAQLWHVRQKIFSTLDGLFVV
ncbi:MAG: 1-acyl-sn-glycerol-3-phosphate acyltransferase [Bacteroidota bacterium]|nr:1-acyl-sn-glycerol-3-phosphate acyltransferase [Bacteroidota bacterium]